MKSFVHLTLAAVLVSACAVTSHADTIWATGNNGNQLVTIDTVTGAAVTVGNSGRSGFFGDAFDTNGTLYGLTGWNGPASFVTVNQSTGATTPVSVITGPTALPLEIDAGGIVYSVGYIDAVLYRVNKSTGAFTAVGNTGIFNVMDIAYDMTGNLWATVNNTLWTINTTTGASTLQTSMSGVQNIMGIAFDSSNQLFAIDFTSTSALYRVNTTTGASVKIADTGISFAHGGDINTAAVVPLPAAACGGLALMSFMGLKRRRTLKAE